MAARYQIGDRVVVTTTFRVEDGTPTSPSTVVGECRSPDGTVTALAPSASAPGVWRMTLPTFDERGTWSWYIAGISGVIAADQGVIFVDRKYTAVA